MWKALLERWADWVGDRSLEQAIHAQLRRQGYAVHAARIRNVQLVAIERPGWVQVQSFCVETFSDDKQPVTLHGLARNDGRSTRTDVLLSRRTSEINTQLDVWAEGLIRRRNR